MNSYIAKKSPIFFSEKKLLISGIVLFFFSALFVFFLSNENIKITGQQTGTDYSFDYFTSYIEKNIFSKIAVDLENGQINENFFRLSLFVILIILIFSILSASKFLQNKPLTLLVSIIVSLIAVVGIKTADLAILTQTYGVLGVVLVLILPLVIMLFFSSQILQGKVSVGKIIFQMVLWCYYLLFSFYFLMSYANRKVGSFQPLNLSWWTEFFRTEGISAMVISFSLLAGVTILIFNKKFRQWVRNLGREMQEEVKK